MKKTWKIPVTWSVCSTVEVEADTLEEAMKIAEDKEGEIPCPVFPDYVDGSWELSHTDAEFIRNFYNDGQEDVEECE